MSDEKRHSDPAADEAAPPEGDPPSARTTASGGEKPLPVDRPPTAVAASHDLRPDPGAGAAPRPRGQLATALPWFGRIHPAVWRLLLFIGVAAAVVVVLLVFSDLLLPLLVGLALAYLFDPMVSWFENRNMPRSLGVAVLAVLLVLVVTGFFFYVIPQINEQVQRLVERMPAYEQRLQATIEPWLDRTKARYPEQWAEIQEKARVELESRLPDIATAVAEVVRGLFSSLGSAFLFLFNLVFVPVFAFYLLVDFPKIRNRVVDLIPLPYREVVLDRVREVDDAVSNFLRGQLVIALILAAINAIGLMILDVPLGLVIGIVAGLANMIPYMALVVGLLPALLLSWVEHQSLLNLVGVVAVFSGAQMLEGMVLSPRILGASVNLHPVWVLLAIIIGGSAFGVVGMLVAVPAAAAIQVFVRHWVKSYKQSQVYTGVGEDPG